MAAHRPLGRRLRVINENYTSLAPQNTLFPSQHVASCYTDPMPATGTYSYSSTSTFSETLVTWNPLIGASRTVTEAPFGTIISQSGDAADDNPFRFSTKYHEAADVGASGDTPRLVYYGYRFYDPEFGRWVSRDPIGERGGLNRYAFVGNSPLNTVDPLGLKPCKVFIWIGHGHRVRAHLEKSKYHDEEKKKAYGHAIFACKVTLKMTENPKVANVLTKYQPSIVLGLGLT